jgi:AcrR family transcriptional regulator
VSTPTSASRRPRRDAIENRADIIAAATDLFARDPHASVDAIARSAGLSRRALYGHFDDRDALVGAVVAIGAQRFNAIALDEAHVHDTADALAPVRRRVAAIVREGQDAGVLRTDVSAPTLARLVEETARAVITRMDASSSEARSLAVRAVLGIAGLSWTEAQALLAEHPDLLEEV